MEKTELWNGRPSPKEVYGHLAALALNVVNLVHPDPVTYVTAIGMTATVGSFTGLEVANLTTPENEKKIGALAQGLGVMLANRGAATAAVALATNNPDILVPGVIMFGAGLLFIQKGSRLAREVNVSS